MEVNEKVNGIYFRAAGDFFIIKPASKHQDKLTAERRHHISSLKHLNLNNLHLLRFRCFTDV